MRHPPIFLPFNYREKHGSCFLYIDKTLLRRYNVTEKQLQNIKRCGSMSQLEKAIERIKRCPKDYTYDEAKNLMSKLGFIEDNKGNTSGSRVRFFREKDKRVVLLHKPHPQTTMKMYAVKALKEFLESTGDI